MYVLVPGIYFKLRSSRELRAVVFVLQIEYYLSRIVRARPRDVLRGLPARHLSHIDIVGAAAVQGTEAIVAAIQQRVSPVLVHLISYTGILYSVQTV